MCLFCKIKDIPEYKGLLKEMVKKDLERLKATKEIGTKDYPILKERVYSSIDYPVLLNYPYFEARRVFAIPHNYYQDIFLNGRRMGNQFSHGSLRAIFFYEKNLIVFSKTINHKEGKEFFTSFILVMLTPEEYEKKIEEKRITIRANLPKKMKNLITEKIEERRISFNFVHENIDNKIISKEQVMESSKFREIYSKYGGAERRTDSIDLEGYAISVNHFSPHPYMFRFKEKLGFESNREMQEHVIDYFKEHGK